MKIQDTPPLHLTYCLNIHPGETWAENFAAIREDARRVRDAVCGEAVPFGLGLRLGDQASRELAGPASPAGRPQAAADFRKFLQENNLYVFTINGFPYGAFHRTTVKENVYAPDWRAPQRVEYTIRLADILAALLPEGVPGSISTVPGSYKPWIRSEADVKAMTDNLAAVADHLRRLGEETGRDICLALEPEPDCYVETTDEVIALFNGPLARYGQGVRDHLGICLDTAHAAVEFEDPADAASRLLKAGIRIAKVQLSAAMRVKGTGAFTGGVSEKAPVPFAHVREKLREFCDEVYLHQTRVRHGDRIFSYPDLPAALEECAKPASPARLPTGGGQAGRPQAGESEEWRVHFHVPLFFEEFEGLESTSDLLTGDFAALLREGITEHLEIETYTFNVLPDSVRPPDLPAAIAKEYQWMLTNCGFSASHR